MQRSLGVEWGLPLCNDVALVGLGPVWEAKQEKPTLSSLLKDMYVASGNVKGHSSPLGQTINGFLWVPFAAKSLPACTWTDPRDTDTAEWASSVFMFSNLLMSYDLQSYTGRAAISTGKPMTSRALLSRPLLVL